jgi:hypothetical protein
VRAIDLAAFYGWWITEGSAITNYWEGSARRLVSITQVKKQNLDKIAELLDRLPWHFYYNERVHKFLCASKQLFDEVAQWGRLQEARRVPTWIKNSSVEVIAAFMETAIAGDGWHQCGDCRVIATICKELADDYQELFVKLGTAPRVQLRKAAPYKIGNSSGDNTRDQYHVHENAHIKKASLDGGGNGQRGFFGRLVPYNGDVYCATVPNGTLICRRNGQVFIAGNCRIYARAAAASIRFETWSTEKWDELQRQITVEQPTPVSAARGSYTATPVPKFKATRALEDWLDG